MPLSVSDELGPYKILVPLGARGTSEVWKAHDTRVDRVVAIEMCKAEFSEPSLQRPGQSRR
jgi:eukaryotic-like serine/threonine-protein kinase